MIKSATTSIAKASFRDVIIREDGTHFVTDWKSNQAQDTQAILTARLYAGEAVKGIQFLAMGSGLAGWDVTPPTEGEDPLFYSATKLLSENSRVAINSSRFSYLNPSDDSLIVDGSKTRKIELTVDIPNEAIEGLTLREFALFGGDATVVADSGLMINWFTHDKIEVSGDRIIRTIRIKWLTMEEVSVL